MSTHSPIKRVIEGKSYNTATATLVHEEELPSNDVYGPEFDPCLQLYRTRFGKFFLVNRNESYWNHAINEGDMRDTITPLDYGQAIKWMEKFCNNKIEEFMEVAEAGDPSTTLTLRMDKGLKFQLNAIAVKNNVSMNVWCVQALANTVSRPSPLA